MKNVFLYQLDGKLPNLALMRIAAHHRDLGDKVRLQVGRLPRIENTAASNCGTLGVGRIRCPTSELQSWSDFNGGSSELTTSEFHGRRGQVIAIGQKA